MKKNLKIFLLIFIALCLTGCSGIKDAMKKVPFLEDADVDALTDKAEKAWDEVGKDALKDAAGNAADTIFGDEPNLSWPSNDTVKEVPPIQTGLISKISEKNSITEIIVKEVTALGYKEYISLLTETFGEPVLSGIYRYENKLISVIFDENTSVLTLNVSVIKQNIESSSTEEDISEE